MASGQYTTQVNIGTININQRVTRTGEQEATWEVVLPIASAGTLTTRTLDTSGVATLPTGHGIVMGDTIDVYFAGGVAYGATVDAADATTVTFSGASGTILPAQDDPVTVGKVTTINTALDGDEIHLAAISYEGGNSSTTGQCHLDMQDAGTLSIYTDTFNVNQPKVYDIDGGDTNPFVGNPIATSLCSSGVDGVAVTVKIAALVDPTP